MWARLQLGAGMFYGSSAVLSVVSALRGRRATWRWNELMGPSTMRGLGVLDTVAAKPVPRRGAQRRERASKRRKFMPKTACSQLPGSACARGASPVSAQSVPRPPCCASNGVSTPLVRGTPCTDGRPSENTPPWLGLLHQSSLPNAAKGYPPRAREFFGGKRARRGAS